jgi:hypothetical protein
VEARPHTATALPWTVFVLALGEAMVIHYDRQPPAAYVWLAIAGAAALAATLCPAERLLPAQLRAHAEELVLALAAIALVVEVWGLATANVSWSVMRASPVVRVLSLGAVSCGVLAALSFFPRGRLGWTWLSLLVAAHAALGIYVVSVTPNPWIDVHLFHASSIRELLAGRSPYGHLNENLYRGLPFYAPELLTPDGGKVRIGFPYPPLQLLLAAPVHLLAGDYRYLQSLALTVSGLLMALARPSRIAAAAAGLFLLSPRLFLTLEGSWTEPMVALFLSLTLFCAVRAPRLLPWALGGLFAIKQYGVLLAPLAIFLLPEDRRSGRALLRLLVHAGLIAFALALPFLLWSPRGFIEDVVLFQFRQPFRIDSLSVTAQVAMHTGRQLPVWLGFAALFAAEAVGFRLSGRDPAGFSAFGALGFLLFFALGKQAFPNYYFFVLTLGAWALALTSAVPPKNAASTAQTAHEVTQGT